LRAKKIWAIYVNKIIPGLLATLLFDLYPDGNIAFGKLAFGEVLEHKTLGSSVRTPLFS
jgi:hypothetical protein